MKQITEDYCSYEIAKLLKEKGFDEPCCSCYLLLDKGGYTEIEMCDECHQGERYDSEDSSWRFGTLLLRPTLQMAMKWLREVHHLFIGCGPRLSFTDFYWITTNIYRVRKKSSLYHTEDVDDYSCVASCDDNSYEEACEAAIKYCLENLI